MFLKLITPFIFMTIGALITLLTPFSPLNYINEIVIIGSLFLATALFANVQSVDRDFLQKYKKQSIIAVSVGLLFKAVLLGGILYFITSDIRFFLIGALISQIDPGLTNWANRILGQKDDTAKLSLVESTFDDPISTLLTIYIALPFVLGKSLDLNLYFFMLIVNFIFVAIFLFEKRRAKIESSFLSSTAIVVGGLLNVFLGVALSGLLFRMKSELFDEPVRLITFASYITVGFFIPLAGLNILYGLLLAAVLVLLVRPLEVFIFFKDLKLKDKIRLSLAEQKGITTVLLLLLIQPQINIIGIVIPAMIAINAWFVISHMVAKSYLQT